MRIQEPIDILTVQELHDKLEALIAEGKGNNYVALPVCNYDEYDADYVFASGDRSFELTDSYGKVVYLEALTAEEDIVAGMILEM